MKPQTSPSIAWSQIGIVVGLEAEARVARPLERDRPDRNRPGRESPSPALGARIAIGGGDEAGAGRAAAQLVQSGVQALVSFGLAGGLDPALAPGALLVPACVNAAGHNHVCDPALSAMLGGADGSTLLGGGEIVVKAADKARLFAAHGAAAVDLESGAVAQVAAQHGLPFAVLRAVCDPATRDLPPAALIALDAKGRIGLLRVIASVLRRPAQIGGLLALARDAARARSALAQRAAMLARG